jgi:hypothetical protein
LGFHINPAAVHNPFSMGLWLVNLLIFLVTLPLFGPVVIKAFRLERSARRLFGTAAQTVTSATNGFTARPFHAGKTEFTGEQLTGFTRYLSSQLVVCSIFTDDGIFLTFSMGKSPLAGNDPSAVSYIHFDPSGNIRVNIANRDYRKFRKKYSFDRLCEAVSALFKRFLQYYINNQESRIQTELSSS